MDQPKHWKQLKRHPLSGEYEDIVGKPWDDFVANLRRIGNPTGREIVVHDDMILDGWQFQRAHVQLDKRPRYRELPPDITPEEYVETLNDYRRDQLQAVKEQRAKSRRERVAVARQAGDSTRVIAETEGVSPSTIAKDIEIISTAQGAQLEPSDGVVIGKDGKKRKAKAKKAKAEPAAPKEPEKLLDAIEQEVPESLRDVFTKAEEFSEIVNQLNAINRKLKELSEHPAGACLRLQNAQISLKDLKESVRFDKPYVVCQTR